MGLTVVALPALTSVVEGWLSQREDLFLFWGQCLALVPGLPGNYLRKCYYRLTLRRCTLDWEIGFLAFFTHRTAEVGRRVYVGPGALVGTATLGDGALVGSRASILSGQRQHCFAPDGKLTPCTPASLDRVHVGAESWIGEGAVVMSDVGSRCVVAAGSVVANPVPDGCMVGGNPARFVRRLAGAEAVP